jgi:integrase
MAEERAVYDYGGGVVMYEPQRGERYWRIAYLDEAGKKRWTSAVSKDAGDEKCRRLAGAAAAGTQPSRHPWSRLVTSYETHVIPHLDEVHAQADEYTIDKWLKGGVAPDRVACRDLRASHFQPVMDSIANAGLKRATQQATRRVASRILTHGRGEGYIGRDQDPLSGLRYLPAAVAEDDDDDLFDEDAIRPVRPDEVPTHAAIEAFSATMRRMFGPVEELYIQAACYTGGRWGELSALRGRHVLHSRLVDNPSSIRIARKVVELSKTPTRGPHKGQRMYETAPKEWRRRFAWYPPVTPTGYELGAQLVARATEVGPDGLMFPAPTGGWRRRSNYRRRRWVPAAEATPEWGSWNVHLCRHSYATYLWIDLGLPEDDCTVFTGHRTSKVFHDIYVGVRSGAAARALTAHERWAARQAEAGE